MVSAGVSYEGKGRLHFIDEKAKSMLSTTWRNFCLSLSTTVTLRWETISISSRMERPRGAKMVQDWLASHCLDLIDKDSWPTNSRDLNPLDYAVWGAMLEICNKLTTKPKNIPDHLE